MKTPSQWNDILVQCQVRPTTAARWAEHFSSIILSDTFSAGESELDDFLGQILHESGGLEHVEENLNYSADALIAKFGRHRISIEDAKKYGRTATQKANQKMIANCLYGGGWGLKNLGNIELEDGWICRGSGLIQVTGLRNLTNLAQKIDWNKDPRELAEALRQDKEIALKVSVLWWEGNIPDSIMGDIVKVSKRVNGGKIGLAHRTELTDKAEDALA